METAALVISVFAVLLSVVVAGWAIYLQWSMFKASTDQLNLMGKENARLGQTIATSLGQLHETATTTRSRLDTTLDQLISGLLGRGAPGLGGPAEPPEKLHAELQAWRVEQAVTILRDFPTARAVLQSLGGGAREVPSVIAELRGLRPKTEPEDEWVVDVAGMVSVLRALDLLAIDADKDTVCLTAEASEVAARLSEAGRD